MAKRSRFGRWLARLTELLSRRYYEGPEPPRRLAQQVAGFVAINPKAGRAEWMRFAVEHGNECYRSGYVRGLERSMRDPETIDPLLLEAAESGREHSWVDLAPSEADVQAAVEQRGDALERMSPEDRLLYMDRIGQQMGGFRVTLLDSTLGRRKSKP